jgi:hypothetical protein
LRRLGQAAWVAAVETLHGIRLGVV